MFERPVLFLSIFPVLAALILSSEAVAARRDASFLDPGLSSAGGRNVSAEAITIEPKSEIDMGDTIINISRRMTLFFANNTVAPIGVIGVEAAGDGNVKSEVVSDDCTKETTIAPSSRCSVVVEITPISPGSWTAEVLMTHDGTGRIAKAKLSGKTAGMTSNDKKDTGLSLSTKDIKPIDFEKIEIGENKAARSALMVNDSAETITILSIDVIAAENGLERLEQGCVVDMDLKPGESCPVTLVWKPVFKGQLSTDLIIRHSGKMGFAVIPVRGLAIEDESNKNEVSKDTVAGKNNDVAKNGAVPQKSGSAEIPSAAAEILQKAVSGDIPPLSADALPAGAVSSGGQKSLEEFHLIGTVGNRAVLLTPDGETKIADIEEEITYGGGLTAKLTKVLPREAEIFVDGKRKKLILEAAASLKEKKSKQANEKEETEKNPFSKKSSDNKSTKAER